MIKPIVFQILLFLFFSELFAQNYNTTEALLNDPDVLWVGAMETSQLWDEWDDDKQLDAAYLETVGIKTGNKVLYRNIKQVAARSGETRYVFNSEDLMLRNILEETLKDKKKTASLELYSDVELQKKMSVKTAGELVQKVDTVEGRIRISDLHVVDLQYYRVKQLVYYHRKNNAFSVYNVAFAPIRVYDGEDKYLKAEPFFWMKTENKTELQDLNRPEISWACRGMRTYDLSEAKVLKKEKSLEDCIDLLLEGIRKNAAKEEIKHSTFSGQLEAEYVKKMALPSESVAAYRKTTQFRFYREWYWDAGKNKLMTTPCFFAPIYESVPVGSDSGMKMPLFYKACSPGLK